VKERSWFLNRLKIAALLATTFVHAISAAAQSAANLPPTALMNTQQLEQTGVAKLTPAERTQLDSWIKAYAAVVGPDLVASNGGGVVESRIDGEYKGWEGETIYKLINGQIWQQASYTYRYKYKFSPKVLIFKSGSYYKMQVEGDDGDPVAVRRLK
jgi:hypothetical protein